MTREEQAAWDELEERRNLSLEGIRLCEDRLASDPGNKVARKLLARQKRILRQINRILPERKDT